MAKISTIKRLLKEDFPQQSWIDKLLQPLNQFMETFVTALNKNLTMDNIKGSLPTITYTTTAENRFKAGIGGTPKVVMIGKVVPKSGNWSDITGSPVVVWDYMHQTDQVDIKNITGLAAGKYEITFFLMGE